MPIGFPILFLMHYEIKGIRKSENNSKITTNHKLIQMCFMLAMWGDVCDRD